MANCFCFGFYLGFERDKPGEPSCNSILVPELETVSDRKI